MESFNSKTETKTLAERVAAVAFGGLDFALDRIKDAALGGGWAETADKFAAQIALTESAKETPSAIYGVGIPPRPERPRAV